MRLRLCDSSLALPFKGRVGWGWVARARALLPCEALPTRHPFSISSSRRRPGSSSLPCSHLPRLATTDPHPCVFRSPSLASESLSLACPRESNQREGHPGWGASAARRFATGGRVPLTGHPWPAAESARSLAPTPAGPFRPPSAAPHGDPESRAKQSSFYRVGFSPPMRTTTVG